MLEAEHDGSRAELRLGELNRPSKIIITQQLLVILARRNTTLDLRLLQPPDLHHFLGNCPGRSQKFVAPHSEHAYFGTSKSESLQGPVRGSAISDGVAFGKFDAMWIYRFGSCTKIPLG